MAVTAGNNQVTASWTPVTGATSYNIYYRTSTGVTTTNGTKVTGAISGGAITGLTNGTAYFFIVTAVNASGESAASAEASVTLPLPAPAGVSATAGVSQVSIDWSAVDNVTSYNVYYRTSSGVTTANGTKVASAISGGAITGLTYGTAYYFVVTAVNGITESAVSSEVAAVPLQPTPAVPTGVGMVAGNGQATATWTAVTGATSYNAYYRTSPGVTKSNGTKVTGVTSGAAITGLVNGTTYYFAISAVNAGGESAASNEAGVTLSLPAPTGVTASAGSSQAALSWSAVSGATSYNVYYQTTTGVTTTNGTKVTGAISGGAITGLTNAQIYYFVVTAVNNAGAESAVSNEASATPVATPSAPTGLAATWSSNQIALTWSAVSGAASYNVYYGATGNVTVANGAKVSGAVSGQAITGLVAGTAYNFIVTAVNASGESAASGQAGATTYAPPLGVSAVADNAQVAVSWSPVSIATSYNIYYGTTAGVVGSTKITGATSGAAITGLANGTAYYFAVTAVNSTGETSASLQVGATPLSQTLGAPTGVSATGGVGQVTVGWTAVAGATSYNIYYGFISGVTKATGTLKTGAVSGGAVTGLTTGTPYYFIVVAVDANGEGPASSQVSATPGIPVPAAPTAVTATAGNGKTTLTWTASSSATNYNVYYRTSAGVTTTNGTKVTGATSGAAITGLTNGTTYYFVVTAANSGGESAISSEASALPYAPPASAPTGVSATAGAGQVTLNWNPVGFTPSTGTPSYNVYYGTANGVSATNGTKIANVASGVVITGLTNGATYYFAVAAYSNGGEGGYSSEVSATPGSASPPKPASLSATPSISADGAPQVTLSWLVPSGVTSHNVYFRTFPGVTKSNGTKVSNAISGDAISPLTAGTTYYFVVTAVNAFGEGELSDEISATPFGIPSAPTGLAAVAGAKQVTLTWSSVPLTSGATSYNVYYGTATGVTIANGTKVANVSSGVTVGGLTDGATYYFVATAVSVVGEGAVSAEVSATPRTVATRLGSGPNSNSSFIINTTSNLRGWGNNGAGELGDGTLVGKTASVQVNGISNVVSVAGGGAHTVAIKNDGAVWAWGYNADGELGNGATVNSSAPVQVSGLTTGAISTAAGVRHSLAAKSDGTVWAWGLNSSGQLGDGSTTSRSLPVQVGTVTNIVAVAAGGNHSLALKNDGTVWAWGLNGNGQLGDGSTTNRSAPVQVGTVANIVAVAAGGNHSLALKSDGTVWGWGSNGNGQLGDNSSTDRTSPVQVKDAAGTGTIANIVAVAAGGNHSVALKNDGTVWVWGSNGSGQLGVGTGSGYTVNVTAVSGGAITAVTVGTGGAAYAVGDVIRVTGGGNGDALLTVTAISGTGYMGPVTAVSITSGGTGYAVAGGLTTNGTLRPSLVAGIGVGTGFTINITNYAAGAITALSLGAGGSGYAVGDIIKVSGAGNGDALLTVAAISGTGPAGPVSSVNITSGGTGYAALGTGVATVRTHSQLNGGTVSVSAGLAHTLVLKNDGAVYAWGNNANGELGDGSTTNRSTSVQATGIGPSSLSAPGIVTVVSGGGGTQNTIAWGAATGALSYNIYWSTSPFVTVTGGTKIAGVSSGYVHTGLTNGTKYYYIVTAINAFGESHASQEAHN